jgi:hypothetical protein
MSKRPLFALLVAMALVGAALPAWAVTFGQPDGDGHPNVGLIYFQVADGGVYRCSGTLIAPTVVLTAAHCTADGGELTSRSWVTFASEVHIDDWALQLGDEGFAAYLDSRKEDFVTGQGIPHPGYDDFASWPDTFDIGVVELDEAVRDVAPAALPALGLLEALPASERDGFTVVGYGLQGVLTPFYAGERARYRGEVSLVGTNGTWNGDGHSATFTNNPGAGNGSGGSCFGDSGGPVFRGDEVVAVVSWGVSPCIGVDYQFRTDTVLAQDFLAEHLPKPKAPAKRR